jgi:RNA polymerase sigma-70 factor (ECF subfamily)
MDSDAISVRSTGCSGRDSLPERRVERIDDASTFPSIYTPKPIKESGLPEQRTYPEPEFSDEFLLEQLREGNHGALALLFRRYARLVRTVAYRILRDAAEAEDLLQEVFLFIFRKWALFDASRGSARSWIVQVTYHRAIDRRRHLASRNFYDSAELDETLLSMDGPIADSAFYERSIEGSLGTEMLSKIAEALSIDQRRTIQLYFFEGYTFEEIAELTKQMIGNVRNHYYRGLEKIRKLVFAPELRDK